MKKKIFQALQNDELDTTPKNSTSRKSSLNSPSPGRFLDPSKEWRPHFDLTVSYILISLLKDLYTILIP